MTRTQSWLHRFIFGPPDPDPCPCMACGGEMRYTGEIITTPMGIPVLVCKDCGARAEVVFDLKDLPQRR